MYYRDSEDESGDEYDEASASEESEEYNYPDIGDSSPGPTKSEIPLLCEINSTILKLSHSNPIAFAVSGISLPTPGLHIIGHGAIGLPLTPYDADIIASRAQQLSSATKAAAKKCNTWDIDAKSVALKNPNWKKAVEDTVIPAICEGLDLGSGGRVSAEFKKLRLCRPGPSIQPVVKIDKKTRIFGTLSICLPSQHKGGNVNLTYENQSYTFDSAKASEFEFSCATWWLQAKQDLKPITSGNRLELVYDIIRVSKTSGVPLSPSSHGYTEQLSRQLKLYHTQLEQKDAILPLFLILKLRNKYNDCIKNAQALTGSDASVYQSLASISKDLKFELYFAELDRNVYKERWVSADIERESERDELLHNIFGSDGSTFEGALSDLHKNLLDPSINENDLVEWDSEPNESSYYYSHYGNDSYDEDVTYTCSENVVVLVPPEGKPDFLSRADSKGHQIMMYLRQLQNEIAQDPSKEPLLQRLCELVLRGVPVAEVRKDKYETEKPAPLDCALIDEAAGTALDLDRLDLFDCANRLSSGRVVLKNTAGLGRLVAQIGIQQANNTLIKGVEATSTLATKITFLHSVEAAFKAYTPHPDLVTTEQFEDWSDSIIYRIISGLPLGDKAAASALAQICEAVKWERFEARMKSRVLRSTTTARIVFVNELVKCSRKLSNEQRSFIISLIANIWNGFTYNGSWGGMDDSITGYNSTLGELLHPELLNNADLGAIVKHTMAFLPDQNGSELVESSMLAAVPRAPLGAVAFTFIWFIQGLLAHEFSYFEPNSGIVRPSHETLVQAFLIKYIQMFVGLQPQPPRNWRLPKFDCTCPDCKLVNTFLQDKEQKEFHLQALGKRRDHLDRIFGRQKDVQFYVHVDKSVTPFIWRMTKRRFAYEQSYKEWLHRAGAVQQLFIAMVDTNDKRILLKGYLGDLWDIIVNVKVEQLPSLAGMCERSALVGKDGNIEPGVKTRGKRKRAKRGETAPNGPTKRARKRSSGTEKLADKEKENQEAEFEVVDLTET